MEMKIVWEESSAAQRQANAQKREKNALALMDTVEKEPSAATKLAQMRLQIAETVTLLTSGLATAHQELSAALISRPEGQFVMAREAAVHVMEIVFVESSEYAAQTQEHVNKEKKTANAKVTVNALEVDIAAMACVNQRKRSASTARGIRKNLGVQETRCVAGT